MLFLTSAESLSKLLPSLVVQFGLLTTEEAKDLTLKKLLNGETLKAIAANLKKLLTDKLLTAGVITQTQAENGYNVALAITQLLTGNISGLSFLAAAAIAALTVAMVAATVAFIDANTGINGYNKKIEETSKKVSEAKDTYEELRSTVESYKDARNGIDQLTVGTLEFYDAVLKSNEAAQELIDKMNLMAGSDYTIGTGGLIEIKSDKLEEKLYKEQQKVYRATAQNYQARVDKENYILEQKRQELDTAVNKYYQNGTILAEGNSFDISNAQIPEKAIYSQAYESALTWKQALTDAFIKGYADALTSKTYAEMDINTQKIVQNAVMESMENNKNEAAYEQDIVSFYENIPIIKDVYGGIGKFISDFLPSGPIGKAISSWSLANPLTSGIVGIGTYDKYQEKEIKEQYLKEGLGYTQEGGVLGAFTQ